MYILDMKKKFLYDVQKHDDEILIYYNLRKIFIELSKPKNNKELKYYTDSLNNNVLFFNLGGSEGYTNKVNFHVPATKVSTLGEPIKFSIEEFNEILLANKELKSSTLRVSEEGLLKINFENEDGVKVSYVLVGKE